MRTVMPISSWSALREAEEESGLRDLVIEREIFDLDRHWIPDHGAVPGHWHYDLRYVVRCCGDEQFAVSEEIARAGLV